MPTFSGAQNFIVSGSQLIDNSTSATHILSGPSGIDVLREASCPEAAHDADSREYPPRCFPGTREQYIKDIVNWAIPTPGDTPAPVYWMKGPAGVGKSAVAQTCAEELKDRKYLGAAFFFSVSGRKKPGEFFPSIAYQLSTTHPPYRDIINNKILNDKTLVKKAMSFQFRYLIDEPLRELELQGKGIGKRITVIIDGLDECEGTDAQREIIHIVAKAASVGTLPLCWAFFSRPEPHIEATFAEITIAPHCHKVIFPISRGVDGEIELYLRHGFENILKRRNTSTQSPWPTVNDLEILVDAAGGLFIYAETILRYVDHLGLLAPQKRLCAIIDTILNRRKNDPRAGTSIDAPFAELDAFYTLILKRIPTEMFPSVHLLLTLLGRWGLLGVIFAANILGMSKDEFEAVCSHASAVVHLQGPGKDIELDPTTDTSSTYTQLNSGVLVNLSQQVVYELGGQVSFFHKSFDDFLLDPARSGIYCAREALIKHFFKMHLDYDRTYSWEGQKLVLAPGVTDSASSLLYPYTNETVNSLIKARIYCFLGIGNDTQSLPKLGAFGALDTMSDFRKNLHVATHITSKIVLPRANLVWGSKCRTRSYPGISIRWISLAKFDINIFKLVVKQYKQANIIQPYHPKWPSWIGLLFRNKTRERFESALYRQGHDEKSIFWYWEIDYKLGHYRHFEAIDLAEGEKRFREEDFDAWPEWEEL